MKILKNIIPFLVWIVLVSTPTWGQVIPKHDGFVTDQAGVFSKREIEILKSELQAFSDSTSNQIVVVTMNDLQGYMPFEVATKIGQEWGVGQDGFDNGIVILLKPKSASSKGQVFIAPGYGLEGAIPDATTKLIVQNEMIPYFKRGQMFNGVVAAIIPLKALAVGEYNSDQYANHSKNTGSWFPFIMLLMVFGIAMISRFRAARTYSVGHNLPFWTALMLMNQSRGHSGHYNNFTSGGGGFGGGGFGGFGGGGFGGGGAGGSW
ncbi:MAG: TPM domain-containing protein [Salibacteraceae bacterium]